MRIAQMIETVPDDNGGHYIVIDTPDEWVELIESIHGYHHAIAAHLLSKMLRQPQWLPTFPVVVFDFVAELIDQMIEDGQEFTHELSIRDFVCEHGVERVIEIAEKHRG